MCGAFPVTDMSIEENCFDEARKQVSGSSIKRVVEIFESPAGNQARNTSDKHNIVVEVGTMLDTQTQVGANVVVNSALKDKGLENLGLVEPHKVGVSDQLGLRSQVSVDPEIEQLQSRIHEVGLADDLT